MYSRNMRSQMARERAYKNMHALREQGRKEIFLRGAGQGLVFVIIGSIIMVLNIEHLGNPSVFAALRQLPIWVWIVGGGTGLFGLYWMLRNIWLLGSMLRINKRIDEGENLHAKTQD